MVRPHVHTFSAWFEVSVSRLRPHVAMLGLTSSMCSRRPHALRRTSSLGFPIPQGVPTNSVVSPPREEEGDTGSVVIILWGQSKQLARTASDVAPSSSTQRFKAGWGVALLLRRGVT